MFSKFKLLFFVDVQKYWFIKQIQITVVCFVLFFFCIINISVYKYMYNVTCLSVSFKVRIL